MTILGKCFEPLRGTPLERRFTRPGNRDAYASTLSALGSNEKTAAEADAVKEEIWRQGISETNSNDLEDLSTGAMKLIAAADDLLNRYRERQHLNKSNLDELLKALKGYHFAANTLRRLQQFELSADFYRFSARIGEAILECLSIQEFQRSDEARTIVDWSIRSLLRSRAGYREQGSDDSAESVYIATVDLRRELALRDRRQMAWTSLTVWNCLSRYGTSLKRLLLMFCAWILVLSTLVAIVDGALATPTGSYDLSMHLEKIRLCLFVHFGGSIEVGASQLVDTFQWTEVILKIVGFFWAAVLAQLIIHRTTAR